MKFNQAFRLFFLSTMAESSLIEFQNEYLNNLEAETTRTLKAMENDIRELGPTTL